MEVQADKNRMIQEILLQCRANNTPTTGDLFFSLAFRTDSELKKICSELGIKNKRGGHV